MNAALGHGLAHCSAEGFATVVACVGDLPALRPESVLRVLDASRPHPRSFVADASGVGTTMLIAQDVELPPHFKADPLPLTTPRAQSAWRRRRRLPDRRRSP